MKIFIPIIEEWDAIELKKDNLEEFNNFIKNNGYDLHHFSIDGELKNILFKWNPYSHDYPDTIKVEVGQIFMYNKEYPDICHVIDEMKEDWVIRED